MIKELSIREIQIPFKQSFRHASAERNSTQGIWVTTLSENGNRGYGESCPREYVTGESIASSFRFFEVNKNSISSLQDLSDLRRWMSHHKSEIDGNPSAWCAIELALIDLFARETKQTVESLLGLPPVNSIFQYTAILGLSQPSVFQKQLQQYIQWGFTDFKVKISGRKTEDATRIQILKQRLNEECRLRLDANNLWNNTSEAIRYLYNLDISFFAIEEPLPPSQFENLAILSEETGVRIILDESFLRIEQFENIQDDFDCWIVNLRVSKMGGILRSLEIARKAKELNIPLIIGAQVGETSLLTRAALTVAQIHYDNVLGQEGAFGTHLLCSDVTEKPIMFGKNGCLNPSDFIEPHGTGFGLSITKSP